MTFRCDFSQSSAPWKAWCVAQRRTITGIYFAPGCQNYSKASSWRIESRNFGNYVVEQAMPVLGSGVTFPPLCPMWNYWLRVAQFLRQLIWTTSKRLRNFGIKRKVIPCHQNCLILTFGTITLSRDSF